MKKEFTLFLSTCKCGHRYLGASSRKKIVGESYFGSGTEWREHLKTCEVVSYEELDRTSNHNLHCQRAEELSEIYDIVENKNFFNVQTERGVPKNNGHVGVGDWDRELQDIWRSRDDEPKPSYGDALNYISEIDEDKDIVVDIEEIALNEVLVENLLSELSEREIEILKSRFGIGCKPQLLEEVAERLPKYDSVGNAIGTGISKQTVRSIEAYALKKIRRKVLDNDLAFLRYSPCRNEERHYDYH